MYMRRCATCIIQMETIHKVAECRDAKIQGVPMHPEQDTKRAMYQGCRTDRNLVW